MQRLTAVLLFLILANDRSTAAIYDQYIFAPLAWVQTVLLDPIASVRPFDLAIAIILIASAGKLAKLPKVKPMRTVLFVQVATVLAFLIYGQARGGGDFKSGCWQVYLMLTNVLLAFALVAVFRTVEDFKVLGKVVVYAAIYHAVMCWRFYLGPQKSMWPPPEYSTCHDDTVLWVVAIVILIANAIEKHNRKTSLQALAAVVFIIIAIQFNNRRLAWVSLIMGLVELFVLLPMGPARRRVVRTIAMIIPVIALYAIVGWGRQEKMFAPLKSFATVSVEEDASTKARNMENLGLIATGNSSSLLMGTGWGHGYIEVSNKYAIYGFELWKFVPHNSILGVLAFSGCLGFIGFWLPFPTAMFLNARVARLGNSPAIRTQGLVGASLMLVCANQMYGDMGDFSYRTMYILAGSYALAMRLPILAGVWPDASGKRAAQGRPAVRTQAA